MNCVNCEQNKITPKPYGGFMCSKEHLQCNECNQLGGGLCSVCHNHTNFVQMNFNACERTENKPVPSAPPLEGQCSVSNIESMNSCRFPKMFYVDIETQSSISQEHLSMKGSHETVSDFGTTPQFGVNLNDTRVEDKYQLTLNDNKVPEIFPKHVTLKSDQAEVTADVSNDLWKASKYSNHVQLQKLCNSDDSHLNSLQQHFSSAEASNQQSQQASSNYAFRFRMENGIIVVDRNNIRSSVQETNDNLNILDMENDRGPVPEDTDVDNIIHTSEIRFMDSTESLKNYYSGGTQHKIKSNTATGSILTSSTARSHPKPLSEKLLQDFENEHTCNHSNMVQQYLQTYDPVAMAQPAEQDNNPNASEALHLAQMRSICVSTESEPSLMGQGVVSKRELPRKYVPNEYLIMQATATVGPAAGTLAQAHTKDAAHPNIDIRMQKLLETLQENAHQGSVSEKPLLATSKNFIKIPTSMVREHGSSLQQVVATIPEEEAQPICTCHINELSPLAHDKSSEVSNVLRAFYHPPYEKICALHEQRYVSHVVEPPPQFQLINCPHSLLNDLIQEKSSLISIKPMSATKLKFPRIPIHCPETLCKQLIFVSDFSNHMGMYHSKCPMERISPNQCKNFFLDPHLGRAGALKCHLLYLIRHKITDLGNSAYKDFLPMLVMSSRITLSQICGLTDFSGTDSEFLMIWLTGVVPEEISVNVSLTVWSRSGKVPSCHKVYSGELYSMRNSQAIIDVCRSGQVILLSENDVDILSKGGHDMLELQVLVH